MMKKTTQPTENLQEQGRTPKGRFAKGFAQNPTGRKAGSRNKGTEAALALMEGQLEQGNSKPYKSGLRRRFGGNSTDIGKVCFSLQGKGASAV